jgi:hypothetical protein
MPKLKEGSVGRYVVLPKQLDKWLEKKAKQHGLNSPQKYAVMVLSDIQRTESEQQKAAA